MGGPAACPGGGEKMSISIEKVAKNFTPELLGSLFDHTYLKPPVRLKHIQKLSDEANAIGSFICIPLSRFEDACQYVKSNGLTRIMGIAVVGVEFPSGEVASRQKAAAIESFLGLDDIPDEFDMVANRGLLKDGDVKRYREDVNGVAGAVARLNKESGRKIILKVIQENCDLTNDEKRLATRITAEMGQKHEISIFSKTSTGFGFPQEGIAKGATLEDVELMREVLDEIDYPVGIKPAGGVGDSEMALKMIIATGGVDKNGIPREDIRERVRLGASAGLEIVGDFRQKFKS